ncbi:LamG-like jellyroll fold domain-containing protein [Sporosarcina globispora]|uniref:LamG-like jellyroll fold domain-containing protein n=1 Tax=Sporosarcina globispora TaxID=1459 RepID=UPI0013792532|nr:LamG-like jellyroll fold domain-containing protein [Sporosarcina globispora]
MGATLFNSIPGLPASAAASAASSSSIMNPAGAENPIFSFMSISDIHVNTTNLAKALNDSVANNVSAIVSNGDMVNYQRDDEYDTVINAMNATKHAPVYYTIGNHEYDYDPDFNISKNRYLKKTGMPGLYYDKWIEGYHFIFLGFEERPAFISDEQISWLESKLASKADPSKPIFLFLHFPLGSTVVSTYPSNNYVGVEFLQQQKIKEVLAKYPQAILTTGHIHDDVKSQGNLYSKEFSAVNDGCVTCGQGLIFDVYKNKVQIRGRDLKTLTTIWNGTIQLEPNKNGAYKAEDGVFAYATVNASGSKVVNMNDGRAYLEMLRVDGGASGGKKILKIKYATDAANASMGVYVNGTKVQTLSVPTTGGMSSYNDLAVAIELNPGPNNKIVIKSDGNAAGMNIDKLQIMKSTDPSTMWGFNGNGNDSIKNGLIATLHGSAAYDKTDKMEGSASLSLNGYAGNYASAGLASTKTDNVTLTAWVKWNGATSGSQQILSNGDGLTNGYSIVLDHGQGDKVSIAINGQTILSSQTALTAGQWTNITAARRSGTWELYINGNSVPVTQKQKTPATPRRGTYIGADSRGKQSFNGRIDAVRIYNQALSTDQIKAIANETSDAKLESITITNLPTKRIYSLGESVNTSGMTVVGTYSDGSSRNVNVSADNITGFKSIAEEMGQKVTVNVGGKTATYRVDIYTVKPGVQSVPGLIPAPSYNAMSSVLLSDDGQMVIYLNKNTWLDYVVNVESTGTYRADFLVGAARDGAIDFIVDGVYQKTISLPSTGGWTSWKTRSDTVELSKGAHTIRLKIKETGFDFRSFEFVKMND